jgi:hypothetical protein
VLFIRPLPAVVLDVVRSRVWGKFPPGFRSNRAPVRGGSRGGAGVQTTVAGWKMRIFPGVFLNHKIDADMQIPASVKTE